MSQNRTASARLAEGSTFPGAPVSLESILCTDEVDRRPPRAPDFEAENHALTALTQALADSPRSILQTLADTILHVLRSDSAGISLLTEGQLKKPFRPERLIDELNWSFRTEDKLLPGQVAVDVPNRSPLLRTHYFCTSWLSGRSSFSGG